MTVEMAEYYCAMLSIGLGDNFYEDFDKMLKSEDPLTDFTLSLCACISDVNAILHILREYTLDKAVDEQVVCDLILNDMHSRFEAGQMTRRDVVTTLYDIARVLGKPWQAPWLYFYIMSDVMDLYEESIISEEVFNKDFEIWWNAEERDAEKISAQWKEQNRLPKKNSFLSKVGKLFRIQ